MTTSAAVASHNRWKDSSSIKTSAPPTMPFIISRPTSPSFAHTPHPRGPSRNNDAHTPLHLKTSVNGTSFGTKSPDLLSLQRTRKLSVRPKGKQSEASDTPSNIYGMDRLSDPPNGSSTTFSTLESALRTACPEIATLPKRSRNSFFGAASEALTLRLGKRKKTLQPPQTPLPEVIEITATKRESMIGDTEKEERERLRDAAAQSIGLDPEIMARKRSELEDEIEDEADEAHEDNEELTPARSAVDGEGEQRAPPLRVERSLSFSSLTKNRHRAGSLAHSVNHRRSDSNTPAPNLPVFPTTVSNLTSFTQINAVLPKYYPAPSLLKFSLSKQWKTRFIIMTSPVQVVSTGYRPTSAPTVSHLHIFKSQHSIEKEIERLEINEDSVVFVNEHNEEIAGRRNVLRVGGVDCGAMKKGFNREENGRTMWVLQVTDSQELQKWITAIKNSVLGQRSVRAGLGLPSQSLNGTEPRGDLDVMLSIRAQGMMSSPTKDGLEPSRVRGLSVATHPSIGHEQSSSRSTKSAASLRSQSNMSPIKSPNSTTVSTLKGLFSVSNRPRSPSVAASSAGSDENEKSDESFNSMGNNLLTMLRHPERPMSPLATQILPSPPRSPALSQYESQLERKIVPDTLTSDHWLPFRRVSQVNGESVLPFRADQRPFIGSSALQPPPRKRPATTGGPLTSPLNAVSYKYTHANSSAAESLGVCPVLSASPSSPIPIQPPHGATERKPRIPSWSSSTSSFTSGASGSEGSSSRRWSRQGVIPRMLTPPSGSPPPVPTAPEDGTTTPRVQSQPPYSPESSLSRSSSTKSIPSPNPQSGISNMYLFSKRASGSSFQSGSTVNSQTRMGSSRSVTSNRSSMPPPRPAPSTALPPTPTGDGPTKPPSPSPSTKASFRDSFAHRALRLSLAGQPPKTPPSTSLPPRPDEVGFVPRERSSSSSNIPRDLYPIPASPDIPGRAPTPQTPTSNDSNKQHISIKQRLRILSAPSTISTLSPSVPRVTSKDQLYSTSSPDSDVDSFSSVNTRLLVGEPITTMQNDPNFLLLATPVISPPTPPPLSPLHQRSSSGQDSTSDSSLSTPEMPVMASLSPPPWRSQRRSSVPDGDNKEEGDQGDNDDDDVNDGHPISNANRTSLVSPPPLSSAVSIANLSF